MTSGSYAQRRSAVQTYFDRTAVDAWARLTSDEPVSRIRATVRAGRDEMRATLLSWLPADLSGRRILDAGCGTGAFAVEAARRGAQVVAIDVAPTLISLAGSRTPSDLGSGSVDFRVGDMLGAELGVFDHVVSMDALIHYEKDDAVRALAALAGLTTRSIIFTFAPRTPVLGAMHSIGKLFPRSDRSPAIHPVKPAALERAIGAHAELAGWSLGRSQRVKRGFYISQSMELLRR
jgi:magnesium-protoporphyrin O-methyltransferase